MFQNTIPAQLPICLYEVRFRHRLLSQRSTLDPGHGPRFESQLWCNVAVYLCDELSAVIKEEEPSEVAIVNQTISDGSMGGEGKSRVTWGAMPACLIVACPRPSLEFCLSCSVAK